MPNRCQKIIAIFLAAMILSIPARPAKADLVTVRVGDRGEYGRIVFNWPAPVPFTARVAGRGLVIQFRRPIEADFSGLPGSLRNYIGAPRLSNGGRTITFPLTRALRVRSFPLGMAVIVDLFSVAGEGDRPPSPASPAPASPAQAPPPPPPPPPPPAPAPAPAAVRRSSEPSAGVVALRTGQHENYSRLVFDWPRRVSYGVSRQGGTATITFERPARINVGRLNRSALRFISGARSSVAGSRTIVTLQVPAGSRLRHFPSGPKVVVDVMKPDYTKVAKGPDNQPEPPAAVTGGTVGAGAPEKKAGKKAGKRIEKTDNKESSPAAKTGGAPVRLKPSMADRVPEKKASLPAGKKATGSGAEKAPGKAPGLASSPPPPGEKIDAVSLSVKWNEPVAAAVFRRGEDLWIVFDKVVKIDTKALLVAGQGAIRAIEQVPSDLGTLLRFSTISGINPSLRREGLTWIFDFKRQPLEAQTAIEVKPEPNSPVGARLFLPVLQAGRALPLRDTQVGDNLIVIPVMPLGHGMATKYRYPQMTLLATAQGLVIRPRIDDLRVRPTRQGVDLTSADSLRISSLTAKLKAATKVKSFQSLSRIFKTGVWRQARREGMSNFEGKQRKLLGRISRTKPPTLQKARFELALFYFSLGFAPEAIGVQAQMLKKEPEIIGNPRFRLLRGATNFQLRRYDEAENDLNHPGLDDNDEGEFWRAIVQAGKGDLVGAAETLKRTGGIYRAYPHALKLPLGMLVASSAIATGDIKYGANTLQVLAEEKPTDIEVDQLALIEGQLRELTGNTDMAVAAWEAVAKGEHRPSIAKAIVARADLLLKKGKIKPEEAIEEFEKLRFSWRGGEFEFELLRKLGRLYFSIGDYRNGLRILRQAASYFRDNEKAPEVTEEMAKAFRELYLNDAADSMPPVRAIALFEEFKELTPSGADGDEMFRKLADRLAKVDLLDQAAKLLTQQVVYRLEGVQKARVGARLATIHLINRDPAQAEETLKKTATSGLPADLATQRKLLMARALVDDGRHPLALALLEDDESEDADLLRSEVHWQRRDWPNAAKVLHRLLRFAKAAPGKPLNDEQSELVLNLTVAYALGANDLSIERLRKDYGAAIAQTPLKDAFNLIASPNSAGMIDYRTISGKVKQVSNFKRFMAVYRERIKSGKLSQLN